MNIALAIQEGLKKGFGDLYNHDLSIDEIALQPTRKEFEGTYTFVTFPFAKISKKNPIETGEELGKFLVDQCDEVRGFNVVKGFLNIVVADQCWIAAINHIAHVPDWGRAEANGSKVMVEYASPNTNKPLHLGHLRNIFLGHAVSEIYEALGYEVVRVQIINDRGIHICKSMVAWQKFGNGETPESSGMKGDKLVGKYYVQFDKVYKSQIAELVGGGKSKEEAEKQAPILIEAQDMLLKWEAHDDDTYDLWSKMNGWVYDGFSASYEQMGVVFDKLYYESDTYLLGKDEIEDGLKNGHFYQKEDGSVWIDLTDEGLDEKIVRRSDGTAVYMTQDIGTAIQRFKEYPGLKKLIYTVGNEQDYHFKVLFLILKKLGFEWTNGCFHLSYGMVDLPSGKMKSREGTVVDADDIMAEMIQTAEDHTIELGKIDGFSNEQAAELYEILGLGALKYFLLKVDPRKRMLFDPKESIEFHGNTGPFIQYSHARISAILRRADELKIDRTADTGELKIATVEAELIFLIAEFDNKLQLAADDYNPSIVAQYIYDLAKEYNKFYAECPIFGDDALITAFRIKLSAQTARVIKSGMLLLGIKVPDRM